MGDSGCSSEDQNVDDNVASKGLAYKVSVVIECYWKLMCVSFGQRLCLHFTHVL